MGEGVSILRKTRKKVLHSVSRRASSSLFNQSINQMTSPLTLGEKVIGDFEVEICGDCGDDSGILWANWQDGSPLTYQELAQFEAKYLGALVWGDLIDRR
jgi:hypothetical protein